MSKIKKATIIAGAAVGGVIGGTISLIGKMTNKKIVDEIGSSIVDSTIMTGEIVGDAASGTVNVVGGMMTKKDEKVRQGKHELKRAGRQVTGNVVTNVKNVARQSSEVGKGITSGDKKRAVEGARKLGKMVAVGMLTVGTVKIEENEAEAAKEPDVIVEYPQKPQVAVDDGNKSENEN